MQLRYVFTELGQGLRRNLSMHLAVVLTLFVSLTLVGLGALLQQQAVKAEKHWGSLLQITVFLCKENDGNARCQGEVTKPQKDAIFKVIKNNPEVAGYHVESKQEAFEKVKELIGEDRLEGPNPVATADAMPETVWIDLKDPDQYEGIQSAVKSLDGVSSTRDLREVLGPVYKVMDRFQWGSWIFALVLVVAALMLVANTIRLAAFARRKEIGIMRLVGASSAYITLPFLLEAIVTAAIGVAMACAAVLSFWAFVIRGQLADEFPFVPWIDFDAAALAALVIVVLGPLLTLLPTLLLTRKYIKV